MAAIDFGPIYKVFSLYECMIVAHITTNKSNIDDAFLSRVNSDDTFPIMVLPYDGSSLVNSDFNVNGRACITSFDWKKLLEFKLSGMWKRPLKILLDNKKNSFIKVKENFKHSEHDYISPPLLVWNRASESKLIVPLKHM